MLVSWRTTFSSTCLLPCSTSPSTPTTTYLFKANNPTRKFWLPCFTKTVKPRICAIYSDGVPRYATWEDPDDGSNSDYESEDDEAEEEDEWEPVEEEGSFDVSSGESTTTINKYEEELAEEVEQLLVPEERAILEQNEAPVLSKISTSKWGLLHTLALSAQIPAMDKLLVQGVSIDEPDKDGLTALHKAVIGKREAVISHLLRKGANPHVRDKGGASPLHYAVQVGAMQTVKLLIKYKVDVNVADDEGWTPLHVAIQSRCRDIAKVLLVNGADKTRRTKDGVSVLDLSLCYGKDFKSYELAKLVKPVPAGIDP